MRFADFLRSTVLLFAGSATALAAVTVISATRDLDSVVVYVSVAWWLTACGYGLIAGRRAEASPPIARLLATARSQAMLPELRPGLTLLNRLWPLLVMTSAAALLGIVVPQVSSVLAGVGMVGALALRRQHMAVMAIEERDAARFYVDRTSPFQPIRLVRTPGFGGKFVTVS